MKVTSLFNELTVHPSVRAPKPFRLGSFFLSFSPGANFPFSFYCVTAREKEYNDSESTGKLPVFTKNLRQNLRQLYAKMGLSFNNCDYKLNYTSYLLLQYT